MHPILFTLFGFPVRSYGVMAALGFLSAVGTWMWLGRRDKEFPQELAVDLGVWLMLSGILGSRIAYVVANWSHYRVPHWPAGGRTCPASARHRHC